MRVFDPRARLSARVGGGMLALGLALGGVVCSALAAGDPFPEVRPATRAEAIELLCGEDSHPAACLRQQLSGRSAGRALGHSPAVRRAIELIGRGIAYADVQELAGPGGTLIRYTADPGAFDRVAPSDADHDGRPDVVEATAQGLDLARQLLLGQLELAEPPVSEVLLLELGTRVDGYVLPASGRGRGALLVLDATPGGSGAARRAAIRQYAFAAVTASGSFPAAWAEAFATWSALALEGIDASSEALISERLRRLDAGLLSGDSDLAAGNAVWFSFLEQAYGLTAVRVAVEELAKPIPVTAALDRAVRRASSDDLTSAFREFHLWALLTGDRADTHHFSYAHGLRFPGFAATNSGLPALSVHREPPVASLGATQIRLVPREGRGGLRLHFEGDFSGRWEVDLLLVSRRGALHRLPLPLSAEGRGELTVPLDGLGEAWMLVRNLQGDEGVPHSYTYSARHERGFPFEILALDVAAAEETIGGVLVSWETGSEQQLVGFNILRRPADGGTEQTVNPVWVPALGRHGSDTAYRFLDRSARPGLGYVYRIQGITTSGLSSFSEPVTLTPAPEPRP